MITELLTTWSLSQVIIFIIALVLAIKELIGIIDFFKEKNNKFFVSKKEKEELKDLVLETNNKLEDIIAHFDEAIKKHSDTLQILIDSDKDDIKGYIVERYHHFMEQGYIDDFSMDVLEKRFAHYVAEGGNSFIERIMNELRSLPNKPNEEK